MSDYVFVLSSGKEIPVIINTKRGLKNITLRPKVVPQPEIVISKPWLVSAGTAIKFLESKQRWIENVFKSMPVKSVIKSGDKINFLGREVLVLHNSGVRSNHFDAQGCVLTVGGGEDMFQRRVRDFIKSEFLKEVKAIIKTAPREFWPRKIVIRDTVSRWGSCSSTGTMSFSWRLALAPVDVMRYVVMHELAHVKHMDHSPEFWATVRELYGFGVERAKRWLVSNGAQLHCYF